MRLYKDRNFENAELFTDVYKVELIDDVIYEVEGETVTERFDSTQVNTGANASAEEPDEAGDVQSTTGPNFVSACQLKLLESKFTKKEFLVYLKAYLKTLVFPEDRKAELQKKIENYMKTKVLPNFKNFDQYVGKDLIVDLEDTPYPMICLLNYREDTDKPYMVVFKHGLTEENL
ncbi:translationally-controlled tumor protein homolog [Acanthaster planci]|uniref:Translationally-controlled tumor protein homolog n=1 Tax=Acanthaster planci TaxID=133434 RepID=A0A8B7YPJ3_ACAPL|nr:translationally-controlled tumor protein homolog [Acanthaster planci]